MNRFATAKAKMWNGKSYQATNPFLGKLKYNFVATPCKFIIAKLSIRKLGIIISSDEDLSLWIESFAIINLCGVSRKLYFNLIFTMKTYKKSLLVIVFY